MCWCTVIPIASGRTAGGDFPLQPRLGEYSKGGNPASYGMLDNDVLSVIDSMIKVSLRRSRLIRNLPTTKMRRKSARKRRFPDNGTASLASTEWVDIVNEENEVIAQATGNKCGHSVCVIVQLISSCMWHGQNSGPASYRDKRLFTRQLDATAGGVVQADEQLLESALAKRKKSWALPVSPLPSTGSLFRR